MKNEMNLVWLVFHIIQISLFQFYAAPRLSHLTWNLLRKRNPEVADETLGSKRCLHSSKVDGTIGVLSIMTLVVGYVTNMPILYWSGKYLSLFGFLFTNLVLDLYQYEKFKKLIPLKQKRSATLQPRTLGRIVPIWAWLLCIIASLIMIIIEKDPMQKISTTFAVLVCIAGAIFTEKKSKVSDDVGEDQLFRKSEAWTIFAIACTFPLFIPLKAHLRHYGIDAVFSTVPLIAFAYFLNSKIYKKLIS
jgi:hypothetical protein